MSKTKNNFTSQYYSQHYKSIQWPKYEQLWPHIQSYFQSPKMGTLLDIGIGPAWFEEFLEKKKIKMKRIVGVDISEQAIRPVNEKITYILEENFDTEEKFDVVICFDSWHLCPQVNLEKFVKQNGILVMSEPQPFAQKLDDWPPKNVIFDGMVGDTEKSRVLVVAF